MGHEYDDPVSKPEKQDSGCAPNNNDNNTLDKSESETVIGIPKGLSKSGINCQTSSVEGSNDDSWEKAKISEEENDEDEDEGKCKLKLKSWVVDLKSGEDEEIRVCRICHLSNEETSKDCFKDQKNEVIKLGCGCNGELSVAHSCCAEAWFKLKGNRICEICGETVHNVWGVGNDTFMEEWIDSRANREMHNSFERSQDGCWHGQPLCNFLMACLVIAFVLTWFFHINVF